MSARWAAGSTCGEAAIEEEEEEKEEMEEEEEEEDEETVWRNKREQTARN